MRYQLKLLLSVCITSVLWSCAAPNDASDSGTETSNLEATSGQETPATETSGDPKAANCLKSQSELKCAIDKINELEANGLDLHNQSPEKKLRDELTKVEGNFPLYLSKKTYYACDNTMGRLNTTISNLNLSSSEDLKDAKNFADVKKVYGCE